MWIRRTLVVVSLAVGLGVVASGCGGDSDETADPGAGGSGGSGGGGAGGGGGASCGTLEAPLELTVTGIEPAAGASVVNSDIVHRWRVVGAPGLFQRFDLALAAGHTAGQLEPAEIQILARQEGADVTYEGSPVRWAQAPGHVEVSVATVYQTAGGCYYRFPAPLLNYDVTAP